MIFQDPMTSLNPVLTIGRQISEALELHMGMDKQPGHASAAIELLEMVGIPEARPAHRRLSAPVLGRHAPAGDDRHGPLLQPQILIADEPTTALDVTIQAQIVDLVKRLRDELGMAVIWITHDLGVVAGLADA